MTTWEIPRESREWVGPIDVTITVSGSPVAVPANEVKVALLPLRQRPVDGDWVDPTPEPGGTGIGVQADPVDAPGRWGIWVQANDNPEVPVLDPSQVGWVDRT